MSRSSSVMSSLALRLPRAFGGPLLWRRRVPTGLLNIRGSGGAKGVAEQQCYEQPSSKAPTGFGWPTPLEEESADRAPQY